MLTVELLPEYKRATMTESTVFTTNKSKEALDPNGTEAYDEEQNFPSPINLRRGGGGYKSPSHVPQRQYKGGSWRPILK